MRKNFLRCLALMIMPGVFTSCQFLPEEEVLPAIPVIHSYETTEYEQATVMRGDLVLGKTVSCTYVPAKEESLSFSLGDVSIDKVYVREGQQVREGQLLAELEQEKLKEQIADQEYQLEILNLKRTHLLENLELDLLKHDIILADLEWGLAHTEGYWLGTLEQEKEQQLLKRSEVEALYAENLQDLEDSIYLQEIWLEEMKEKLKERQIYAGIDGTITYALSIAEGDRSVKGKRVFTISDMDTTVFKIKGEDVQYFPVGTRVILTCNKKEFAAYAVDASELGIDRAREGDESLAYLKLTQPDPTLEDGDKGTIQLTLDERKDVLYVNTDAIRVSDGQTFVYMLNEEGLRVMQEVTTGLESGNFVEITSGLEEGDRVITE